jgi:hypothetical protein
MLSAFPPKVVKRRVALRPSGYDAGSALPPFRAGASKGQIDETRIPVEPSSAKKRVTRQGKNVAAKRLRDGWKNCPMRDRSGRLLRPRCGKSSGGFHLCGAARELACSVEEFPNFEGTGRHR